MRKLTFSFFILLTAFLFIPLQSQAASFPVNSETEFKTVSSKYGQFFLRKQNTDNCSQLLQIASIRNEKFSGWSSINCSNKNNTISISEPFITVDPESNRIFILQNKITQSAKGIKIKTFFVTEGFTSLKGTGKWKKFTVSKQKTKAYDAGAITATAYRKKLWIAYQKPSSNVFAKNNQFYVYGVNYKGKKITKNLTAKKRSRLKIDGRYSSLAGNQNSFYLVPQNGQITLSWTLEDITGNQHSFAAKWKSNVKNPKSKFLGKNPFAAIGVTRSKNIYSSGFLAVGGAGRYYFHQAQTIFPVEAEPYALANIYAFNSSANSFSKLIASKKIPINQLYPSRYGLPVLGMGVDRSGRSYIVTAESNLIEDCVTETNPQYWCWKDITPDIDKQVITVSKFNSNSNSIPYEETKTILPYFGEFKPASQLIRWIASEHNVYRVSQHAGSKIYYYSGVGQEGMSPGGSITPTTITRIYQRQIG